MELYASTGAFHFCRGFLRQSFDSLFSYGTGFLCFGLALGREELNDASMDG